VLKNILIITMLLCLIFATACTDNIFDNKKSNQQQTFQNIESLVGTQWELVYFFDAEKNEIRELEPKSSNYTLSFVSDTFARSYSACNMTAGEYIINYSTATIDFDSIWATTLAGCPEAEEDERFWNNVLHKAKYLSSTEEELKLFHNNKKSHLLFRKYEPRKNYLVRTDWYLLGFYDADKGEYSELYAPSHITNNALVFQTDSTVSGQSHLNRMTGEYTIGYSDSTIKFSRFSSVTTADSHPDEAIYSTLMLQVSSFSYYKHSDYDNYFELKLFLNDRKSFLHFWRAF